MFSNSPTPNISGNCILAQKPVRWKKRIPRITKPSTTMFLELQESVLDLFWTAYLTVPRALMLLTVSQHPHATWTRSPSARTGTIMSMKGRDMKSHPSLKRPSPLENNSPSEVAIPYLPVKESMTEKKFMVA